MAQQYNRWHLTKGEIEMLEPGNPAAGASVDYTFPANYIYRLEAVYWQLVTDANAANRKVIIRFRTTTPADFSLILSPYTQTASLTRAYSLWRGSPMTAWVSEDIYVMGACPEIYLIGGTEKILIDAFNKQAGDQFQAVRLRVEKWRV